MQSKTILSDPLQQYLSERITETTFVDIVIKEIREGSFCQALKWVYPMALSYHKRQPDSSLCEGIEKNLASCRTNLFWRRTTFSEWLPDPSVRAVDIAALSIAPHNIPAMNLSKYILREVFDRRIYGRDLINTIAQEHFAATHGWEIDRITKMIPSVDFWISKAIRGKIGAPLVREILDSARPGCYAKALSLIMPLADHIMTRLEKGKHVLGRQGFSKNGTPMIDVRYFHHARQCRPWENLYAHNKGDARAILIALSSLNIASGFASQPMEENLTRNSVAGLRIYLALNMLACLVPQDEQKTVCGFKGYACSDFLTATRSYLRCHGHLPKPASPRAPFRFSKRPAPVSTVS